MKTIPSQLLTHLALESTTTCLLVRLETKSGSVYGFTNLDIDVVYDDGNGSVTYGSDNGFTPARFESGADLAVDNSEMMGWVSATGITEQQIRAGLFDYAEVIVYRVNYNDLTSGRHEIVASGTAGQTRFDDRGWITEFRSLVQQLRQPISSLYSTTCTAQFGDARCGKSFTWASGSVTAVGAETDRIFTDSALSQADNYFFPGVVEWLTGDNAGVQMEIDLHASDTFTLSMPLPYPIQTGDTYRVRQDCNKVARTVGDVQGDCKDKHNNLARFRGQSFIPVTDGGRSLIPGAEISRA